MSTGDLKEFGPNAGFLTELRELYKVDPTLVAPEWQTYFGNQLGQSSNGWADSSNLNGSNQTYTNREIENHADIFRRYGHFHANINPLQTGSHEPAAPQDLPDILRADESRLSESSKKMRRVYQGSIGFEFVHLSSAQQRDWLAARIESEFPIVDRFSAEQKKKILKQLICAELFESELHKKYVGTKRFSLEGGETLIPMLSELLSQGQSRGLSHAVIGMAHRGRLNVLANIFKKPLEKIFQEFEDKTLASIEGVGDVKYHLGFDTEFTDGASESVKISMPPNPSHLEFVNPVVEGICRALQDSGSFAERSNVLPIVIHGDAAFAGQGIVFETINFSKINGYATAGTLHIIINNQVGFTSTPEEGRSSRYATDLAKGVEAPIFHVNCEDVEASVWVTQLAADFRREFKSDAFVDLYCFRKYGHNEGDDPSFTQPVLYAEIKNKRPVYQIYADILKSKNEANDAEVAEIVESYCARFSTAQVGEVAVGKTVKDISPERLITTAVPREQLLAVAKTLTDYPQGFTVHPKLGKILEKRVESCVEGQGIEWGTAEGLAYGTLIQEGINVRLSGQDCGRGTFSQRHLLLDDYQTAQIYSPLTSLKSGRFEVYNSPLSENSVIGFEFGYASTASKSLVLWEGQFGDFVNGAQVIIDQFISSSEVKWSQLSGLTLLLPHGYEGQGPEHSSSRFERFLQLCVGGNMSVCYPSTAAQYFHLLRQQAHLQNKRPLIIITPKSLLRLPAASATIGQLTDGGFQKFISEDVGPGTSCEITLLMSGKIYHDVKAELTKNAKRGVAIIRVEQLHPLPELDILRTAEKSRKFVWVQEEPENMGAWRYIQSHLKEHFGIDATYIGRPPCSSTATGSSKYHIKEQQEILIQVVNVVDAAQK